MYDYGLGTLDPHCKYMPLPEEQICQLCLGEIDDSVEDYEFMLDDSDGEGQFFHTACLKLKDVRFI